PTAPSVHPVGAAWGVGPAVSGIDDGARNAEAELTRDREPALDVRRRLRGRARSATGMRQAFEVNHEPIRVVQRIDAVTPHAVQIENHARRRALRTTDANLSHHVVTEVQDSVLQVLT